MYSNGLPRLDVEVVFKDEDGVRGSFDVDGRHMNKSTMGNKLVYSENLSDGSRVIRNKSVVTLCLVRVSAYYSYHKYPKWVLNLEKSDIPFNNIEADTDMWMCVDELLRVLGIIGYGGSYSYTYHILRMANKLLPKSCDKFEVPQIGTLEEFQMDML